MATPPIPPRHDPVMLDEIVAVLAPVLPARIRAAAPATCGDAMLVPLMVLVAVVLPIQVLVMLLPGANRSRHEP